MNQVATKPDNSSIMEQVLIKGDLRNLTEEQRTTYYMKVCESVGLNPLTQPFAYILLNSKLTLYALRTATDQLRAVHKVSVEEMTETEREGVFIVTAKVRNAEGRTDIAKGAVNIAGLKGEVLANALMKAETKAKRRATLSICGLGMLDETEVETIPGAEKIDIGPTSGENTARSVYGSAKAMKEKWTKIAGAINECQTNEDINTIKEIYKTDFLSMKSIDQQLFDSLVDMGELRRKAINANPVPIDDGGMTEEEMTHYARTQG